MEVFNAELEKDMDKKACRNHIQMGDVNAEIGVRSANYNLKCVGPFGIGNRNGRGERLLDFTKENNMAGTNLFFQKAANRCWTREAPGRMTKNQTGFIMSSNRKIVGNCEAITKVDLRMA